MSFVVHGLCVPALLSSFSVVAFKEGMVVLKKSGGVEKCMLMHRNRNGGGGSGGSGGSQHVLMC